MSASSAPPMGGTDINYFSSFLSYSPAHQLIDEIRIFLESGPLSRTSYQFGPLLSIKLYKIVDSISCFPYNSRKYEIRISLEFWQNRGSR
jgi:hypothetical protein